MKGYEGARVFIRQYFGGTGDYTKEKYEKPQLSVDEFVEKMRQDNKNEIDGATQ